MHGRVASRLLGATAVACSIVLVGCAAPSTEPAEASVAPTPSAAPRSIVPVPSSVQVIPGQPPLVHYGTVEDPQIGVAYEYHLYLHCGLRQATFGGRGWVVRRSDGARPVMDQSQYATGAMTLVSPELARFEWPGGGADFVPADAPLQPCA